MFFHIFAGIFLGYSLLQVLQSVVTFCLVLAQRLKETCKKNSVPTEESDKVIIVFKSFFYYTRCSNDTHVSLKFVRTRKERMRGQLRQK